MASILPPSPESCVKKMLSLLAKTKWVRSPEFKGNEKSANTNQKIISSRQTCSYSETWQFICTVTKQETDLFNAVFCTAKIYPGQDLEYTALKGRRIQAGQPKNKQEEIICFFRRIYSNTGSFMLTERGQLYLYNIGTKQRFLTLKSGLNFSSLQKMIKYRFVKGKAYIV